MPFRAAGSLFGDAPSTDTITANIDGGARGNPGPSGYGVVFRDASGKRIGELSKYLGHQTNNFAEYSALIAALEYAAQQGWRSLAVISDSELLVKQMKGQYKVSNSVLQEFHARARSLIREHLDRFQIEHVLRAQNKDADELANRAMDAGTGKAPATPTTDVSASPASAAQPTREYNGIVKDGRVEFLGDRPPEGSLVKVRVKTRAELKG